MRTMAAGEFKAKCLAVIEDVNSTGQPMLITKRGKPMVRVLPSLEQSQSDGPDSIFGFMRGMGIITGDIVSSEFTDEEWERMFNEKWDRIEKGPTE